ncbi:hypothetical protein ATY76_04425 [Rhizobium sp. R339]|uniref:hypothetical protein n=1 Tax=Rhizobium sp. R339 TaxID=1764273 RepID=UPI000B5323E3|nr:hypothetical protein [Rhizobium sp. R339]OWV77419.1 hypothetical protein ATY76_04425 [Rhizobium sp. R339]
MLQSLISLDDHEINLVTDAVQQWCSENKLDIDSVEGRRAITIAVDLVQTNTAPEQLLAELSQQMNQR